MLRSLDLATRGRGVPPPSVLLTSKIPLRKGPVPLVTPVASNGMQATLNGKPTSFWHDIPYRSMAGKDTFLFVCEIPAKYVILVL